MGKTLIMSDSIPLTIIGVVENLLDEGVFTTSISPIFYRLADDSCKASALWVRVAPENRQDVYQYLEDEWNKLVPDRPFFGIEGDIFSEASQYISKKILTISFFLVLIATLFSVAGLYSQIPGHLYHRIHCRANGRLLLKCSTDEFNLGVFYGSDSHYFYHTRNPVHALRYE